MLEREECIADATYDIEVPEEAGAHWSGDFEARLRGLRLADQSLDRVLENFQAGDRDSPRKWQPRGQS